MAVRATWNGEPLGDFETREAGDAAVKLAELMSDVSERCYAAGWEHGTEEVLWSALTNGPRKWGVDVISADDIAELKRLSEVVGGWIAYSPAGPRFVPMSEWNKRQRA
jgi:hypothetical protein